MSNVQKILIGCLILLAIAAAALHLKGVRQPATRTGAPAPQASAPQPNPLLVDPRFEDVLAATPGSSTYAAMAAAQAVPTSAIHVTNCRPYPEVSAVAAGQPVKVYNVDATPRTLAGPAGSSLSLTVPAKGTASFTLKAAAPAFTYTCGGTAAGAIVTSK